MIIKTHHGALKMLSSAKKKNFIIIMKNTPTMAKAIKTLCRYILNGTMKLEPKHVKILKLHRKFIRGLADGTHKSINRRVVQKGGSIFQAILKTVLPLIPALL